VGKGWTEAACRWWHRAAGAGGGGDGPVRKMARRPAVQPRGETEKVVERLVWTIWGCCGASTRGW
jgi:hypothetical protein